MHRTIEVGLILVGALLLVGCGAGDVSVSNLGGPAASAGVDASRLATPESSIAYQLELVKAGDVEGIRACVTERLKESVTPEKVEKAKQKAEKMGATVEKIVGPIELGEYKGQPTATIKSPEGRGRLTTLVQVDGKWLSDTIWFD